jgi:hypothetical protein
MLPGADCPVAASKTFALVIATGCFGLRVSVRASSSVRALASASCFSSSFGTLDSHPSRTTEKKRSTEAKNVLSSSIHTVLGEKPSPSMRYAVTRRLFAPSPTLSSSARLMLASPAGSNAMRCPGACNSARASQPSSSGSP